MQKKILILGAAGSLGSAVARFCAQNGHSLFLLDKQAKNLERLSDSLASNNSAEPTLIPFDVLGATPADYEWLSDSLKSACETLDVVIDCAVQFDGLTPIAHLPPQQWFNTLHVNVHAPFLLFQTLLPLVHTSSSHTTHFVYCIDKMAAQKAYYGAYAVSQAAKQSFIELLSAEYNHSPNINIQLFFPAAMQSKLRKKIFPEDDPLAPLTEPSQEAERICELFA